MNVSVLVLLALFAAVLPTPSAAQSSSPGVLSSITQIGSPEDQRLRDQGLRGLVPDKELLIRSPSTLSAWTSRRFVDFDLLVPQAALTWNSRIPLSLNDQALWAGRGVSTTITSGFRLRVGPLSLVAAPELLHIQNRDVRVPASETSDRSAFASPWHTGVETTADLPLRFGNQPLTIVTPGQTTLAVSARGLAVGASSENQWWGPGLRNAIVISNHAAGFPHLFAGTSQPLSLSFGSLSVKWIAGTLTESIYFDSIASNDHRSISGIAAAFRPAFASDLTVGAARTVTRAADSPADALRAAGDVFTRWESRATTTVDGELVPPETDQILSTFARWIFPREGAEVYVEWARVELPTSVRDFLTRPNHTQGYTIGLQWLRPTSDRSALRAQFEVSSVEKGASARQGPAPSYYTGRSTPQGYTHRGQIVGAGIGPGGSSQWFALDLLHGRTSAGAFIGRVRWENDAFYSRPAVTRYDHDVSVFAGIRSVLAASWMDVRGEAIFSRRFNYNFQVAQSDPVRPRPAQDINNLQFRLSLFPRLGHP